MWFLYPDNTTNQIKNFIFSIELIISLFVGLLNVVVFVISVIALINLTNGCCKCCSNLSQINRGIYFVALPWKLYKSIPVKLYFTIELRTPSVQKIFCFILFETLYTGQSFKNDVQYKNYIQGFLFSHHDSCFNNKIKNKKEKIVKMGYDYNIAKLK